MRLKHLAVPALALGVAAGLTTSGSVAAAAGDSATTVTIKAQGTDLSGLVKSSHRKCVDGRKVIVFKQKGARGGGDDTRFASDTASLTMSGAAQWSTGNTGTPGRFYAKVRHIDGCRADTSPTIRASRNS
ncbi:hypothetical protein [Nocardioides panaciterrulae]|uniref:Uncharacterized protein n=1 Tax=Nocardioides panaciterrulae TaxID=661492 RepID=A0A7Y9JBW3_9ACTN|nr:hypothetical protein [Nocardioides panaciterrulae]NYD42606.1 hypothetical protein [Nocardioides panaciterrulae]